MSDKSFTLETHVCLSSLGNEVDFAFSRLIAQHHNQTIGASDL